MCIFGLEIIYHPTNAGEKKGKHTLQVQKENCYCFYLCSGCILFPDMQKDQQKIDLYLEYPLIVNIYV